MNMEAMIRKDVRNYTGFYRLADALLLSPVLPRSHLRFHAWAGKLPWARHFRPSGLV